MARAASKTTDEQVTPAEGEEVAAPKPRARARHKRQPQEVMARIITAATAAFTRDGYKGTRMRAIAIDAGITIQLLVYHVKTKENLWQLVMEQILKRFEKFRSDTGADSAHLSAADRLRQSIADLVHYTASEPELHRIMTLEAARLSPRLVWLTENFTRQSYNEFVLLAEEAQREGAIRADVNPARLRFAVQAMVAVPFSVAAEYEYLTGKSPFTGSEIDRTIELIHHMVFIN
jgi:AcrR family transcriptional regulator